MDKITQIKYMMIEKNVKNEAHLARMMGISPQRLNNAVNSDRLLDRAIKFMSKLD